MQSMYDNAMGNEETYENAMSSEQCRVYSPGVYQLADRGHFLCFEPRTHTQLENQGKLVQEMDSATSK